MGLQRAGHDLLAGQQQDRRSPKPAEPSPRASAVHCPLSRPPQPPPYLNKQSCAGSPLATLMGVGTHHTPLWETPALQTQAPKDLSRTLIPSSPRFRPGKTSPALQRVAASRAWGRSLWLGDNGLPGYQSQGLTQGKVASSGLGPQLSPVN